MKELLSHLIILHLRKLHMTAMICISTRGVQRLLHLAVLLTVAILSYYYSHSNGCEVMTLSPLPSSHYFLFLLHSPNWHTVNYVDGAGFVPLRLPQLPFPYAQIIGWLPCLALALPVSMTVMLSTFDMMDSCLSSQKKHLLKSVAYI